MDFDKEINLDELAKNINMRRELEAQETTSEPVQEYLNMDKITLVKMLLASKEENKKLHDKLDKLREEAQEREAKAEARNEELHASAPRCAVEGKQVRPDRRRIKGSRFHKPGKLRGCSGFPLHVANGAVLDAE